jgi:hypothetical protein
LIPLPSSEGTILPSLPLIPRARSPLLIRRPQRMHSADDRPLHLIVPTASHGPEIKRLF